MNALVISAIDDDSILTNNTFEGSLLLGRPTNSEVTARILSNNENEIYISYWEKNGSVVKRTEIKKVDSEVPVDFVINQLSPSKTYYYVVHSKNSTSNAFSATEAYQFKTPKSISETFNFVIQSDSHLLNKADKMLYTQSMKNMAQLSPDFIFDLGDTFLLDNGGNKSIQLTQDKVNEIYKQQLPFFDLVTRNTPLFFTIGNHESEYGALLNGTVNNIAAMSTVARTTYIPNPIPNEFYSGNSEMDPLFGHIQNYYAFTWGDALYVSIDPYRYGTNAASEDIKGDGWGWTLGKTQYDWFRKTLENSPAKYKFVFSHHAIGNFRGGASIAQLYEWGGYDAKGQYAFDQFRPGWGKPIQQIMHDEQVTIFFQGHDHLFAREDVDGVVYQTLPKPAEVTPDNQNNFSAYHGDVMMNSGFLNITVSPSNVKVDYHRNYLVASGTQTIGNVYSYTVDALGKVTILNKTTDDLTAYGLNQIVKLKTDAKSEKNNQINTNNLKVSHSKNSSSYADYVGIGATSKNLLSTVPKDGFSFVIEADPHFDENTIDDYLNNTALNIINMAPSFLIDLGDTSMLEKLGKTPEAVQKRTVLVNQYFSKFGNLPILNVTGNHDNAINTYKGNYYAYVKGDAHIIVLDPYAFTSLSISKGGGWAPTLGNVQYQWLKNELEKSTSKYRFVFIHNLTGGLDVDGRGGTEAARLFEWGGENTNGVNEFSKMRPNFELPIHDLLVKYDVDVVFHGHDHFYAKQELDGIIYQLVPQPGTPGNSVNDARIYGYQEGVFLPSAGFLRVVISNEKAIVEYIKTEDHEGYSIPDYYEITP